MGWSKSYKNLQAKKEAKAVSTAVDALSPGRAQEYATKLFQLRVKGWGDEPAALADVADRSQMSARNYKRVMKGDIADPNVGVLRRIRAAYLEFCDELASRLQQEIEIETRKYGDEAFEDIGADLAVLRSKIEAAKVRAG
jgi:hypothetical protein